MSCLELTDGFNINNIAVSSIEETERLDIIDIFLLIINRSLVSDKCNVKKSSKKIHIFKIR